MAPEGSPPAPPGAAAGVDGLLRWGGERLRVGPHRGEPGVVGLSLVPDGPLPSAAFVRRCLEQLAQGGVARVVTAALSPGEAAAFLAAGLVLHERLALLEVDLADLPPVPPGLELHRGGRRRRSEVLAVDHRAFQPFWRFDERALLDAMTATPRARHRVAIDARGRVAGYAVCGRAGRRGYVQRLAVDPAAQRAGTGRRLLLDGLHWMARHHVRTAVVNTQLDNVGALALYRSVGFVDDPSGLVVLSGDLRPGGVAGQVP